MLFGKNSDRQRNEAQAVQRVCAAEYPAGAQLKCTYLTIPQARRTNTVLLSCPFWQWGAEMGANEHGVVIGNEGLHARSAAPERNALTGMDILRIGLERAGTAAGAVEVMTELLSQYGQGGDCGHLVPNYYNNGYLITDASEAFVLETVGREWMVERVQGVRTLSNGYSIGTPDRLSAGLPGLIRGFGWNDAEASSYAEAIGDPNREHIGNAGARRARATALLRAGEGQLTALDMMATLRDHGLFDKSGARWDPEHTNNISVCMHARGHDCDGQTTGSLVSEFQAQDAVHWVTATAAPCISIFKPLLLGTPMPDHGSSPTDQFDHRALWWRHERMHRKVLLSNFNSFLENIRHERDALEADFVARINAVLNGGSAAERAHVVAQCWENALAVEDRWYARLSALTLPRDTAYTTAWLKMSRIASVGKST